MNRKLTTIDLSGKAYAQVATRIKEFRGDFPNGLIDTSYELIKEGTEIIFTSRILKDKSDENSGEGKGHSMGKLNAPKAFEKLETISVGRALAMIGYMASGEVASFEEMEEFLSEKDNKRITRMQEVMAIVDEIDNLEDLKACYLENQNLGSEFGKYVGNRKNELLALKQKKDDNS